MEMEINGLTIPYTVEERRVKNARLSMKHGKLQLRVIIPQGYGYVKEFIESNRNWIYRSAQHVLSSQDKVKDIELTYRSEDELKKLAHHYIGIYKRRLGVEVNNIRFKYLKSRWGSCSGLKNVNFNMYLRYMPDEFVEYMVIHELTHLIHMNHSWRFWAVVSNHMPDYRKYDRELKLYWIKIQLEGLEVK